MKKKHEELAEKMVALAKEWSDLFKAYYDKVEQISAEWISVKDRLPEDLKDVLCWDGNDIPPFILCYRQNETWHLSFDPHHTIKGVTYWRYLSPPEDYEEIPDHEIYGDDEKS